MSVNMIAELNAFTAAMAVAEGHRKTLRTVCGLSDSQIGLYALSRAPKRGTIGDEYKKAVITAKKRLEKRREQIRHNAADKAEINSAE
jgi:hypothetical protein